MTAVAIAIAALVIGHAPVPYTCNATPSPGELGVAHVIAGQVVSVTLDPRACFGAFMLGATPAERAAIARLNPTLDVDELEAVGVLALLHESEHAAGYFDESDAECRALALLPAVLARYSTDTAPALLQRLSLMARNFHRTLPAAYRNGCG